MKLSPSVINTTVNLRRSFYQFDMKEPLFNVEAANLFEKDPNLFKHKATECVKLVCHSQSRDTVKKR